MIPHRRHFTTIVCVLCAASAVFPAHSFAQSTYVGPPPVYGGDPAVGETAESYYARTGDTIPPAWLESSSTPTYGGDPAIGETDDSYRARTGDGL